MEMKATVSFYRPLDCLTLSLRLKVCVVGPFLCYPDAPAGMKDSLSQCQTPSGSTAAAESCLSQGHIPFQGRLHLCLTYMVCKGSSPCCYSENSERLS